MLYLIFYAINLVAIVTKQTAGRPQKLLEKLKLYEMLLKKENFSFSFNVFDGRKYFFLIP